MGKLMGAKIGSLHTLDDLGLYLLVGSPLISGAEPDKKLVQVPGGDFLLDLTRAVDGKVHYLQRTIRLDLKCTGFLLLLGVLLGRFICGFLCPFGWFQELLHKIPTKKLSTKKLKPLTYLKYAVLLVMVVLLPAFLVNDVGMGDPYFCKYLCPQGVLEGAIPLSLANSGIRAALGSLFTWKLGILLVVIVLSVLFYRPFCKWICPLGAFYALLNKVSLVQMKVDQSKCISCGKCAKACKMDVDVTKSPNHTECIRCGMCVRACPTNAVHFRCGFGTGKQGTVLPEKTNKQMNDIVKEKKS